MLASTWEILTLGILRGKGVFPTPSRYKVIFWTKGPCSVTQQKKYMRVPRAPSPFLWLICCDPSISHLLLPQFFAMTCRYHVCVRQRDTAKHFTGVNLTVVRKYVHLGLGSDLVMQGSSRKKSQ